MLLASRAIFNELHPVLYRDLEPESRAGISPDATNLLEAHVYDEHGGMLQSLSLKSATFDKHFLAWKIPHQKLKATRVSIWHPTRTSPEN
jgi:hypothetical protein